MKYLKRLTRQERLKTVLNIINKLKRIPANNEIGYINMYKMEYQAIKEIKKVFDEYVNEEDEKLTEKKGKIFFEELNRNIIYLLPTNNRLLPVFKLEYLY
jgi:hypothetical protein